MSFEEKVRAESKGFFIGACDDLTFGETPNGQKYAILITSVVWYAMRLYIELPKFCCCWKEQFSSWDDVVKKKELFVTLLNNGDHVNLCKQIPRLRLQVMQAKESSDGPVRYSNCTPCYGESTPDILSIRNVRKTPSDCAEHPDKYLKRGDVLETDFIAGTVHEGIYIGDGKVIHVSGHGGNKSDSVARVGNLLGHFVKKAGDSIRVVDFQVPSLPHEERVKLAEYLKDREFGKGAYHLLNKNCQHFATLCAMGLGISADAEKLEAALVRYGILAAIPKTKK